MAKVRGTASGCPTCDASRATTAAIWRSRTAMISAVRVRCWSCRSSTVRRAMPPSTARMTKQRCVRCRHRTLASSSNSRRSRESLVTDAPACEPAVAATKAVSAPTPERCRRMPMCAGSVITKSRRVRAQRAARRRVHLAGVRESSHWRVATACASQVPAPKRARERPCALLRRRQRVPERARTPGYRSPR